MSFTKVRQLFMLLIVLGVSGPVVGQSIVSGPGPSLAAGIGHNCAITSAGGVRCWGRNMYGQLGDGTSANRLTAVDVSGLGSGVVSVVTGAGHTCALTAAGGVKCWGVNMYGTLGDGSTATRSEPTDVSGLSSDVTAIAAGNSHTCAVTTAGGVKCWGYNGSGQLGDGTSSNQTTPTDVGGLNSGVTAIATGSSHTCALTTAGAMKCWGNNGNGQLGDGTTANRLTAVDVSGLSSVTAVAAGDAHTCALTTAGGVKCWGNNSSGQIGDGSTTRRLVATDVSGLSGGVAYIATGYYHTCAVTIAGGVKCWGNNGSGQIGDGSTTNQSTPANVSGLNEVVVIAAGMSHTCAKNGRLDVVCWGSNEFGQLGDGTNNARRSSQVDVLGLVSGISKAAAGYQHTCALTNAGGVKCWGDNSSGQMGDGSTTNRPTPTDVSGLSSGVVGLAVGDNHACAITALGGVKCWGNNGNGQLGDGTTTNRLTAVDVSGLSGGVVAIAAGRNHSCAITSLGSVKCWGSNGRGQLGDGTMTWRFTPTDVSGLMSGVTALTAGSQHTCALTTAGGVQCWGNNGNGQLGDGSTTQRLTPVDASGLSGVTGIVAGYYHTCALTTAGGMKCWGGNSYGQLGDSSTTQSLTPVIVRGLTTVVAVIAAGYYHTCAVTAVGGVKCWGRNFEDQLGGGSPTYESAPTDVSGLNGGVAAIAAGSNHTCAVTTGGGMKCWGYNNLGQVGDGTMGYRTDTALPVLGYPLGIQNITVGSLPVIAVGGIGNMTAVGGASGNPVIFSSLTNSICTVSGTDGSTVTGVTAGTCAIAARQDGNSSYAPVQLTLSVALVDAAGFEARDLLAGGSYHTCAVTNMGGLKCWGANWNGDLGNGTSSAPQFRVTDVIGLDSGVVAVTAGNVHTCALMTTGGVKCWGGNWNGQLGNGTTQQSTTPTDVIGLGSGVTAIAAGLSHACALMTAGGVKCWGFNGSGELGDGTTTQRLTPVDVSGLSSGVVAIAAGASHTCALMTTGGVKCWGFNYRGQLGDGSRTDRLTPVDVSSLTSGVVAIRAGYYHTCAITTAGNLKCWGDNGSGQLGNGSAEDELTPVDVTGLNSGVIGIAGGGWHTCALSTTGRVKCWGRNVYGEVGDGSVEGRSTPVDVIGLANGVVAIAAGADHTCAFYSARTVTCWGYNSSGQLGDGYENANVVPVNIVGLSESAKKIAVSASHNCALTISGDVWCWGYNLNGEVGDGSTTQRVTPAHVIGLSGGVTAIGTGGQHACAVDGQGGAKCWGNNGFGQLGNGGTTDRFTPTDVVGLRIGVMAISGGLGQTCAITSTGGVKCWGDNSFGQLGDGTTTQRLTPVDVVGLSSGAIAIEVSDFHACALTSTGGVKCWGDNTYGQLGDGTTTRRLTPVDVVGLTSGVIAIANGYDHSCALTSSGGVKCWGGNGVGQLGDDTTTQRLAPVDVFGLTSGVMAIGVGNAHTCAVTTAGGVKCWGGNAQGQIGDGTYATRLTPIDVTGLTSGVSSISGGGGFHTCALTTAGEVKCWGANIFGQTGYGTYGMRATASLPVLGIAPISQTVTFGTSPTITVGATGTVTAIGGASGNPVTFSSTTASTCTTSGTTGSTVTGIAIGTCTIAANQSGNANYGATAQVTQNITVGAAPTTTTTTSTSTTSTTTTSSTTTTTQVSNNLDLVPSWNLVGNGVEAPITVASTFNDATKVTTVWKWVTTGSTPGMTYPAWAFYTPVFADGGQAYAASKGYEYLTEIGAAEGFWVNAKAAFSVPLPAGATVQSGSFMPAFNSAGWPGGSHALGHGWSLIATGDSPTPAQFDAALDDIPPAPERPVYTNLTTLWAWDASRTSWYFWAPVLVNNGGLAAYLTSKGYLDFATMPGTLAGRLSPSTGLWVNMP